MSQNFAHQAKAVERYTEADYGALFWEPGVGKSRAAIKIIEQKENVRTVLVFCPKSVITTWTEKELPEHSEQPYAVLPWKHNGITEAYKEKYFASIRKDHRLWVVLNYEACLTNQFDRIWKHLVQSRPGYVAVICDESTFIKTHNSRRTRKLISLAKHPNVTFKMILTGTPTTNSPLDVFSQVEFLKPEGRLIGASTWFGARNKYAISKRMVLGERSFDKIVGFQNIDELGDHLSRFADIVKLTDCVDMPERIHKPVYVELTAAQKTHYRNLKNQAITLINTTVLTVTNVVSLINALNQLVNGQFKLSGGAYAAIDNNKIDALIEQLDELAGQKAIVWVPYVEAARKIQEALGFRGVLVSSEDSLDKRDAKITLWRNREGPQALISHPLLLGHGISLPEARAAIYFGRNYSLEQRLQSLARNYRITQAGQTEHLLVIDLIAKGTIDEEIYKALQKKEDLAVSLLDKTRLRQLLGISQLEIA